MNKESEREKKPARLLRAIRMLKPAKLLKPKRVVKRLTEEEIKGEQELADMGLGDYLESIEKDENNKT